MNFSVLILACLVGLAVAAKHCSQKPEDVGKCDCCPEPCCCKCEGEGENIDIAFVVDASGSIGSSDWVKLKNFLKNIVGMFDDVGGKQRFAMVKFASNAVVEWNLAGSQTDSNASLTTAINNMTNIGTFTNIKDALDQTTINVFTNSPGDNPESPNIVVVLTDGRDNIGTAKMEEAATKLQAQATVLAVGVSASVDQGQLEIIATGSGNENTFRVDSFNELDNALLQLITDKLKEQKSCYCCCPPPSFTNFWK